MEYERFRAILYAVISLALLLWIYFSPTLETLIFIVMGYLLILFVCHFSMLILDIIKEVRP